MNDSLLADFGLDLDEIEIPGFDVPDGFYEFTVGDVYLKLGTDNFPDRRWLIVSYLLGESGKNYDEWFELPSVGPDGQPIPGQELTDGVKRSLGYYKARLVSFGFEPEEINRVGRDDIVGLAGSFKLVTTKNKTGKDFQNIRSLKLEGEGGTVEQPVVEAPVAPKRRAPRKTAAAPVAPVETEQAEETADDYPAEDEPAAEEEAVAEVTPPRPVRRTPATTGAAASGRVANPFA